MAVVSGINAPFVLVLDSVLVEHEDEGRSAAKQRFELHKRIARWTWPLWMYVSVTGVVIYLLLYQIFPQPK